MKEKKSNQDVVLNTPFSNPYTREGMKKILFCASKNSKGQWIYSSKVYFREGSNKGTKEVIGRDFANLVYETNKYMFSVPI